jgi:DNA polymerase III gamma/tau subunit
MDTLGLAPKEIVENLAKAILDRNSQGVNESFKKLIYEGYDILAAVKDLRNYFSECFLLSCGFSKSWIVNEDLIKDINPYVFAKLSRKLNRIIEEIKFSDNIAISAEMAIHTIIETPVDLEAIVKKIEKLENVNLSQKEEIKQEKKEAFISISEEKKEKENVDSSVIWQKFLNLISKQEMALYNFLSASSMKLAGDRDWILEFENEFQKDYTLSKMDKIKETLKKITDNDIKISLQIKKKELIEELSNPSQNNIVQKEDNKLKAVWSDIESILPEQNFPEYERIEKILKGHIKKIHKVR